MDAIKNKLDHINAQYGKIPPQALEIEEAVIGALMGSHDIVVGNDIKLNLCSKQTEMQ